MESRKRTFTFTMFVVLSLLVASCSQETLPIDNDDNQTTTNQIEKIEDFAIILSRAVANEEQLRSFIKKEALREFDKDYDVFYPYVKNQLVNESETFESILQRYCDSDVQVETIANSIPKLTILVPSFSWVDDSCFSVHKWDTASNQVAVSYAGDQSCHPLFFQGERIGIISDEQYPSFPILIVKNNERMIEVGSTKSGDSVYDFADPFFNNLSTKVGTWEGDYPNSSNSVSVKRDLFNEDGYRISMSDLQKISPEAIDAFREFNTGWGNGVQRDYVFYGMTTENNVNGELNRFRRDMIYRLKISVDKLYTSMDDSKDPLKEMGTRRGDRPGFDEAVSRMWANGNFELSLDFYQGMKTGDTNHIDHILLSIYPGDLMYIDKCHDVFQWNIFGNNWSVYTIKRENIQSKWYYPSDYNNIICLQNAWNLSDSSQNIFFTVSEIDANTTYKTTTTSSFKYNLSANAEAGGGVIKGSLGGGYENGKSTSFEITNTDGADDLGSGYMEYIDSYITEQLPNDNFTIDCISTYSVEISLLPIDLRNKTSIKSYLANRRNR